MAKSTAELPLGITAIRDRSAYRSKNLLVYVRLYVGEKGHRRYAGEICVQDHEWERLSANLLDVQAVTL